MERGCPEQVAVVGAGVAGCMVAFELSRRGHPVTLIDRAGPGRGGASGVPVALLNPHRGRSGRATPSDLEGLAAFWRLCGELEAEGLDPGAHRTGVLRIAHSRRPARAGRGLGVRWLEPAAVASPNPAP
ncbi:MAG: FAD-dependent oxidoreductase [Truepera sp.]|nr:FAD-dependent oxidoreductase [Truepera sp.]